MIERYCMATPWHPFEKVEALEAENKQLKLQIPPKDLVWITREEMAKWDRYREALEEEIKYVNDGGCYMITVKRIAEQALQKGTTNPPEQAKKE